MENPYLCTQNRTTVKPYNLKTAMKLTKYIFASLSLMLGLASCQDEAGKFHVEGTIGGAEGKTLYLESLTLTDGIVTLDSVKLDKQGDYRFAHGDTTLCPELYRLRIENQFVNFAIDSTETVQISAQWPDVAFNYTVQGSGSSDTIRTLSLRLAQLERDMRAMAENRDYTLIERDSLIRQMVREYKDSVKIRYIQNHYESASSYFALFQGLSGMMLWDMDNDQSDVRWASAVANAWLSKWPGSLRTQNLCNIVLRGRKQTHIHTVDLQLDESKIREAGIIDMGYPDITGQERRLSDLEGQVVLLDFTAYSGETSKERIIEMRQLYQKYHQRGLEIYQVSVDGSIHYWKTACQDLPWICVYCQEGLYSDMLKIYNVQQLPSFFLIDRGNNLVSRGEFIEDIDKAIEALL